MYDALERLPDVEVSPAAPAMYVIYALDSYLISLSCRLEDIVHEEEMCYRWSARLR